MTTQELEEIHVGCGWEKAPDKKWKSPYCRAYFKWRRPFGEGTYIYTNQLPDYEHDVRNIILACQRLNEPDMNEFVEQLKRIVPVAHVGCYDYWLINATAAQRAWAFLNTVRKARVLP